MKKLILALLALLGLGIAAWAQTNYAFGTLTSGSKTVTVTICTGTFTFDPTSINSGASQTITQACTGAVAATDALTLDPTASILAVTGYAPSANGGITIYKWLTADTINAAAVNDTAGAIDPGSITLHYLVTR